MDHEKEKNLENLLLKPPSFAEHAKRVGRRRLPINTSAKDGAGSGLEDKMSEI